MGEGLQLLGPHFIEYPAGVIVESLDSCLISQHYNDQRPVTLRATGLKPIFDEVIAADQLFEATQVSLRVCVSPPPPPPPPPWLTRHP